MKQIDNILHRFFAGTISPEERQELDRWKASHPDTFDWIKKANEEAGEYWPESFDQRSAWKQLEQKLGVSPGNQSVLRRLNVRKYAAAAVLLLAVGFLLWQFLPGNDSLHQVQAAKVESLELEDGTQVTLNVNAQLTYPQQFNREERRVALEGEAYFEVSGEKERPFRVQSAHALVEVLGTAFSVKEMEALEAVEVHVQEGRVQIRSTNQKEKTVVLEKGQGAFIYPDRIVLTQPVDPNHLAWKTGRFSFQRQQLSEVVETLNPYLSQKLTIREGLQVDCPITLQIDIHRKPSEIAATLAQLCRLQVQSQPDMLIFEEK